MGYHIEVGLPGPNDIRRLVAGWFQRKGFNASAEGFDIEAFVQNKAGASPADILHEMDEWANHRAARLMQARNDLLNQEGEV